jgi:predicted phosphodiesterase
MEKRKLPKVHKAQSAYVVIFSDVHIGALEHNPELLESNVQWCLDNKATVILNGDIIENSIVSGDDSAGDKLLAQGESPTEQFKRAVEVFRPLAEKGQIIASTRGNHEARSRRKSLIDVSELVAFSLGVPYIGVGGLVRIEWQGKTWKFAVHHGRSGGRNPWLECAKIADLYPQCDLVALGHNHHLNSTNVGFIRVNDAGEEERGERVYVRTGSYLGYCDYVREMALTPERQGSPCIILPNKGEDSRLQVDLVTLSEDS